MLTASCSAEEARSLADGHRIKLTPDRFERVERYFRWHGGKTILFGRFIGTVRALTPFIAGASGMPARRFVPATVAAAGLWAVACTLLVAYALKRRRRRMAVRVGSPR